jgi:drug/metabolite transporter (DMT)-like permease
MSLNKIIGAVVFAVGVFLLVTAYNATQAPVEELSNTITDRYSDNTTWYFVAGVAAIVGGGLLALFGARK